MAQSILIFKILNHFNFLILLFYEIKSVYKSVYTLGPWNIFEFGFDLRFWPEYFFRWAVISVKFF